MTPTTEQLKDLLAKVTPGSWEEITPEGGIWPPRVFSGSTIVSMVDNSDMTHGEKVANATLIALAPTLADEVVRLRAIIEKVDQYAPVADETCDEPGITFTEAIMRQWPELRPPSP